MSRSKKLYILLGVFVVACIATLAVTQIAERKEQIKNSGEPILELSSDSVQALSWEHKGEKLWRSTGMRHGFMTRTRSFR